ncbi:hypothetical protein M0P25_04300 [archaeon]|nr:hypothetical protein [archaeon]
MCKYCGKEFIPRRKTTQFCSRSCTTTYNNYNGLGKKAGLASVKSQDKRSKNEIYFSELCEKYFHNIETNKQIFNGWDADIIIHDIKYAVLWNGVGIIKK